MSEPSTLTEQDRAHSRRALDLRPERPPLGQPFRVAVDISLSSGRSAARCSAGPEARDHRAGLVAATVVTHLRRREREGTSRDTPIGNSCRPAARRSPGTARRSRGCRVRRWRVGAKWVIHMPYVRIANLSAGWASASAKPRPMNGGRPRVVKNDGVTASPRSCSGCPFVVRFTGRKVKSVASSIASPDLRSR